VGIGLEKKHKHTQNIIDIVIRNRNIITGGKFYVVILLPGGTDYFIKEMKENHKTDKTVLTVPCVSSPPHLGKYLYHSVPLAVHHNPFREEFELRTKVCKLLNYKTYTICIERFTAFNNWPVFRYRFYSLSI
jgi:hypothetical protein